VTGRYPHDVWHCDLTTVPTAAGFWTPWLPFALPQRWPFCWWVALVADHYTRCIMGFALFKQQPTAAQVKSFLDRTARRAKVKPQRIVTDRGAQFTDKAFRTWLRSQNVRQRFGALGQFGSIVVIERLILTLKNECTRRLIVPFTLGALRKELALFTIWYNHERPHRRLAGATPAEACTGGKPACSRPRFEPRPRWPRGSPCAAPAAAVQGRCGARLDLHVSYLEGRKHLPIVTLQRVA